MFSDLFDSPWKVLIIAAVVLVLFGPWMLGILLDYMRQLFSGIPGMIG